MMLTFFSSRGLIDFPGVFLYGGGMLKTVLSLCVGVLVVIAAEAPANFKVAGLNFTRPEKFQWVELPAGGMRAAQLKVAGENEKEAAEVVFFHFPGGGGGVQANVDRWLAQFKEPKDQLKSKVETVKTDKGSITYVQAEGTYMSGMPGGPKTAIPNAMLQGAIVQSAEENVFIRMTGPGAIVKASQEAFKKMAESAVK